jgi:hypothetical protein
VSAAVRSVSRVSATLASITALVVSGGCESVYGIGDLPHGAAAVVGACTPVEMAPVPTTGAAACASAGTCSPGAVTGTPPWVPPVARLGQCTPPQLDDYFSRCIDPSTGTVPTCTAWYQEPANARCYGCLLVNPDAEAYGAAIRIPGTTTFQINTPGCLALAEPCNLPCAKAALAQVVCAYASCDPQNNCAGASDTVLAACLKKATAEPGTSTACACQGYAASAKCLGEISGVAAQKCAGADSVTLYANVAAFLCGPV